MEDFIEPMPLGRIYSIEIGQPKAGFKFNVGQKFKIAGKSVEIVEILRDDNAYILHGKLRYIIYVVEDGGRDIICWKWYEDIPVSVTCFVE